MDRSPTLTQDALLRTLPSAATFRRTPSLVADPTAQGLNLRGLAPSGVARSLVLLDGLPVNDPFGGWVFWRALPRLGLDRIEVVPSGGSALYGSAALGGVVQLVLPAHHRPGARRGPVRSATWAPASSPRASRTAGGAWAPRWRSEGLTSNGYRIVPEGQRGPIDGRRPPTTSAGAGARRGRRPPTTSSSPPARACSARTQNGGTRYTVASVDLTWFAANARLRTEAAGAFELGLHGRTAALRPGPRARVAPDRNFETRSALQDVPADDQGRLAPSRPARS